MGPMDKYLEVSTSSDKKALNPFDPYEKVPREHRRLLRGYAKYLYTKRMAPTLVLNVERLKCLPVQFRKPDYLAYMDRYAESLKDI